MRTADRRATRTEWPTLIVAGVIYGGWIAVTALHAAIPMPVLMLVGGVLIAWQGSLQHETIHGHPTGIRWIDSAIGAVPIALWLPYTLYRRSHLAHHGAAVITDPACDPESRYRTRATGFVAVTARLQSTLIGQMVFGPPLSVGRFLVEEARRAVREPGRALRDWVPHLLGVAVVIGWLDHVGLGFGHYLLAFVYPGMALTMVRSYAEHRADLTSPGRAASVEHAGALGLVFLNNNLHAAHHERPRLAWYDLPGYHRRNRDRFVSAGAPIYRGYGEIVRRFAFGAHDDMLHPAHRPTAE